MPKEEPWIIIDTETDMSLKVYALALDACQWTTDDGEAIEYLTEQAALNAIAAWGETPAGRFIGGHPRPH